MVSGADKLSVLVRLPRVARRRAVRLGAVTPKRSSRSKQGGGVVEDVAVDEATPPRENDNTRAGTRSPRPMDTFA